MAISIVKFREKKAYGVYEFLCDFDSDVKDLMTDCAPGSKAYVVESGKNYIFNNSKKWEIIKDDSDNSENINNYEILENKPQINGNTLSGNKSSDDLGLQSKLTAGTNITIANDGTISASSGVTSYNDLNNKPLIQYYMGSGSYATAPFTGTLSAGLQGPIIISKSGTGVNSQFYVGLDPNQVFLVKKTTSYDINTATQSPFFLALSTNRLSHLPSFVSPKSGTKVSLLNLAGQDTGEQIQLLFWLDSNDDSHYAFRVFGTSWQEIGGDSQIVSGVVNQNGTITFTNSDGTTFTTTGESVIGPQGNPGSTWTPTEENLNDIAQRVLNYLPTAEGVLYGN